VLLVILAPLLLAAVAFALPRAAWRPPVLLVAGLLHAAGVARLWRLPAAPTPGAWLGVDPPGLLALTVASALFLVCAVYAQGYLARRGDRDNRAFSGGLLLLLGSISTVALSQHLGLLWVAIEITTLSTAPLIYFNRNERSLEAAWKYLVVCSVGIAMALIGTFLLALASAGPGGPRSLVVEELVAGGSSLSLPWLRGGFVFLLAGYGTKMGLAPFHAWKPDAYGEAPGLLGALLSGGVTAVGFVSLVRVLRICEAGGAGPFARQGLVAIGILSLCLAAVFVVGQRDFKRMLAYSSVEHMGILVLGIGIGGAAATGAFFHLVTNGLTKGVLFLAAGNIHRAFGSKRTEVVRGAARVLPVSGPVFLAAFLAITGSPPFAPFFSEFAILAGAVKAGAWLPAAAFLLCLSVIFIGMGATVLGVVQGAPPEDLAEPRFGDSLLTAGPPLALMLAVLALGIWVPPPLRALFEAAAASLGGG
jgi:hydrogenase-4 component F